MKILIVEDLPISAVLLRRLLEKQGHEVVVARDGLEAWGLVEATRFPVIISDWVMPGLDGLALCRRVRGQAGRSYSYLILLTSKEGGDERLEGLRAGADDFLTKPANAEELAVRLQIARRILAVQDELERQNRLLAELAHSDELTGVHNRRRFRQLLEVDFAAAGAGAPLSLVMVDVDRFKEYNDAFGHPAGDEVLRRVAGILRDGVGRSGSVARYGGEEFAVLLPARAAEVARAMADQLRFAVASGRWPLRPITASFGVATSGADAARPDLLVRRADQALYRSKHAGRDRVTHALDPEGTPGPARDLAPGGAVCG